MNYYTYNGPVANNFGQIITKQWISETYANTDGKAKSNLNYQFKKQFGLLQTAKVKLLKEPVRN